MLSTFNGEAYLREQLITLLAQREVELDLHVRDDGSSDKTVEILERFQAEHQNVHVLKSENLGVVESYFELMREVPGGADYYAFADQDDIWLPGKLIAAVRCLPEPSELAMYCSALTLADANGSPIGTRYYSLHRPPFCHAPVQNFATGNTMVITRASMRLLRTIPRPKHALMHDWWCCLALCASGARISYDERSHILYRQHDENVLGMKGRVSEFRRRMESLTSSDHYLACLAQAAELAGMGKDVLPDDRRDMLKEFSIRRGRLSHRLANMRASPFGAITAGRAIWYVWNRLLRG